jgi:DNA-binding protein H-NS
MKLAELIQQKAALEAQIAEARKAELAEAISTAKSLIAAHELTVEDLFGATSKRGRKAASAPAEKSKVAAKYRDPISGNEWSGRGLAPKWLQGKNKDDYLIK